MTWVDLSCNSDHLDFPDRMSAWIIQRESVRQQTFLPPPSHWIIPVKYNYLVSSNSNEMISALFSSLYAWSLFFKKRIFILVTIWSVIANILEQKNLTFLMTWTFLSWILIFKPTPLRELLLHIRPHHISDLITYYWLVLLNISQIRLILFPFPQSHTAPLFSEPSGF